MHQTFGPQLTFLHNLRLTNGVDKLPNEKFCSMDNVSSTASMMFVRLLPYMCKFGGETKKYYFQLHHFCSQLHFVVRTQAGSDGLSLSEGLL